VVAEQNNVYIPEHFRVRDHADAIRFMQANSFAILVSSTDEGPFATHLPLVVREAGERVTIRGHVASVQSGSGPAFSLLPPENATGNWVKIVQRVPVKIVMDDPPTDVALGPGMSVETTVRVNARPSLYERLRRWL